MTKSNLPMIREPVEIHEYWVHGLYLGKYVKCPAWECHFLCPDDEELTYLEHLRGHRYEPFMMEKP